MLIITFSDGLVLNLNANQSIRTITVTETSPKLSEPFTLEHNNNGIHLSLMEMLKSCDYFCKTGEEDVFYKSSSVVRIKEV